MVDVVSTETDVRQVGSESLTKVQFGEAAAPPECVYLHTDGKYYLCDADDSAKSQIAGVVMKGNEADGWGQIITVKGAEIDIGGTVTAETTYVVSDTPGGIMPQADLTTGQYVSIVGIGKTTTNIELVLHPTSITHP